MRGAVPLGRTPPPYDSTWAFVLREKPDGTTRLIVRERYEYSRPWSSLLVEPVEIISFIMSQKCCAASETVPKSAASAELRGKRAT